MWKPANGSTEGLPAARGFGFRDTFSSHDMMRILRPLSGSDIWISKISIAATLFLAVLFLAATHLLPDLPGRRFASGNALLPSALAADRSDESETDDVDTETDEDGDVGEGDSSASVSRKPRKASKTALEKLGFDELMKELHAQKKLFDKKSYPLLRKAYAADFAKAHEDTIGNAWGDESAPFRKYMEEHATIREMFFLALDAGKDGDNITAAMNILEDIWKKYPQEFEAYPALAIAVALVWDQPHRAIHGPPIGQHQAVDPGDGADALDNFHFYSHAEKAMGDRVRYMPWEFLTLLVNHRTTMQERKWALEKYLARRANIGNIYGEVPYDYGAIKPGGIPKFKGNDYTLPNVLVYGGVCTCQADFSTRVAKSLGVPAYTAGGGDRFGGGHAWVMWIEIDAISATGMKCSIRSFGRYDGDHYYVGGTVDPALNRDVTDRALEMKLFAIGRDTTAYRLSRIIMQGYETLAKAEDFDARTRLEFLNKVIDLNPLSVEAWRTIAKMVRDGDFEKKDYARLAKCVNRMFRTFALNPDFTWELFDDLISFEQKQKVRGEYYGKLCTLYEAAKRPDLAIKARLKFARQLVEEDKVSEAFRGLAGTCLMFPDEGAILRPLLDEMDKLCLKNASDVEGNYRALAQFYVQFIPKLPKKRGSDPSSFCVEMYEKAITLFERLENPQAAAKFRAELRQIQQAK